MKNTLYIIALSIALVACGGSSGTGVSTNSNSNKDLFSLWKTNDSSGPLDLTAGAFREILLFSSYASNGAQCDCNFVMVGDQESGSYTLNSCTHVQGTGSGSDTPNCNALDHTGLYSKTYTQLTVCDDTQDCTEYK